MNFPHKANDNIQIVKYMRTMWRKLDLTSTYKILKYKRRGYFFHVDIELHLSHFVEQASLRFRICPSLGDIFAESQLNQLSSDFEPHLGDLGF